MIVRHDGRETEMRLERVDGGYRITLGEVVYQVDAASAGLGIRSLLIGGRHHEVSVHADGNGRYQIHTADHNGAVDLVDRLTHLALAREGGLASAGSQTVSAYMPGRVVDVLVREGDEVEKGQGLVILEAMKMENEIQAEVPGVVRKVLIEDGQAVEGGDPLFEIG